MYYYSPKENAFFPEALKQMYLDAGSFPDDVIIVGDDLWEEYAGNPPPEGRIRGSNKKGFPVWINTPPETNEQLSEYAEFEKRSRVTEANQKTQLWQTQLMLGIITDEDKASLTEWMLYVQKVQVVDTSAAPDIIWPEKPE